MFADGAKVRVKATSKTPEVQALKGKVWTVLEHIGHSDWLELVEVVGSFDGDDFEDADTL